MGFRLVLIGLLMFPAWCEVRLAGRVTSDTFAPVGGATVILQCGLERLRALTDPTGGFTLVLPAPADCTASVERSGYFALKNQTVPAGTADLHLILNPIREFAESVDVAASSSAVELDRIASENRLTGAELLDIPYPTTHNFKAAMRVVPGVVTDNTGGVHVNGGGEDQVLYLMDGFNIADPLTGKLESRVSVEGVQSMDVVSGRFPAEYGKGSAGVLSVSTRMGDDRLRYSATNFVPGIENTKGFRIGSWNPRLNLSGPLRRGRAWFSDSLTTQYDQTVVNELPAGADQASSWRYSNLLRAQVNLTPSNILFAGFLANQFAASRTGLTPLDPAETTVDRRSRQWFFDVKDQMYFARGAMLEFGYARNRTFGKQIPQGPELYVMTPYGRRGNYFINGKQEAARDQAILNVFFPGVPLLGEHQLKTGFDLNRLSYHQDLNRTGIDFYGSNALVRRVTFTGDGRVRKTNFESAFYVQDSWRLRRDLLAELGFRMDRDSIIGKWNPSPRIGLAWSPFGRENTKVSGGYAVTYDATSLALFSQPFDQVPVTTFFPPYGTGQEEVRSVFEIPAGELSAARFQTWSASIDQRLAPSVFLKLQGMRRRGTTGLTYLPSDDTRHLLYALSNSRADAYDSMEVTLRHNLRKRYEWLASYTRSRAASNVVISPAVDQPALVAGNFGRLPWDAPNRFVSWGYLPTFWDKWAVAYLAEYRTGFPFSAQNETGRIVGPVNSYRYPDFFELNLHVEYTFGMRGQLWALRVGMNNLTGRDNPNAVINDIQSDQFGRWFGGQRRATVFRIRWIGKS